MGVDDGGSEKESRTFVFRTAEYGWQKFTGTKLMGSEGKEYKLKLPFLD